MVTLDFKRQSSYMKEFNILLQEDSSNYNKIYTTLESDNNGWLKVADSKAPQQGGYNISPLNIDLNSKQVVINFQGDRSVSGADWRASIVVKTKNDETRYSTMWKDGVNTLNLLGDEETVYLVVCATPNQMFNLTSYDLNAVGTKYPYKVQVSIAIAPTYGDLNKDGTTNIIDYISLKKVMLNNNTQSVDLVAADINKDGKTNIMDYICLKKKLMS